MADPSPSPFFSGAAGDADALRRKVQRVRELLVRDLGIAPEDLDREIATAEKLGGSTAHAGELTASAALIARTVPGRVGQLIASLAVGAEKHPDTGKLKPGSSFAGNALPSPLGYGEPKAFGLSPNFYLPAGSTEFIPVVADELGLGLPQQRAIDERNARIAENADLAAQMVDMRKLTDAQLQKITTEPLPYTGGFVGRVVAGSRLKDPTRFLLAAQFVQAERAEAARRITAPAPAPAAGAGISSELVGAISELDRLFAANPPDP